MLNKNNRGHLSGAILNVVKRVRAKAALQCGSLPVLLCALLLVPSVMGQGERQPAVSAPTVTVSATTDRIRFVAPGAVVQLRLEVYTESGKKVFDTELRGGNVLDWHLQDGAGARLTSGSYACVMTIKGLSGRISQRTGLVTVQDKKAAVQASEAPQLSPAQQQAIGPLEGKWRSSRRPDWAPLPGDRVTVLLDVSSKRQCLYPVLNTDVQITLPKK